MGILFSMILVGYIAAKCRVVPENAAGILSKLENTVFFPALVLGTFLNHFTLERIGEAGQYLLAGFAVMIPCIPLAILLSSVLVKDRYTQKIYTYGLAFSNFGFVGNAVVAALYPEIFMEYLIFVLPFWMAIYVWGVPALLIPVDDGAGINSRLKNFCNPMFAGMVIGMGLGLLNAPVPAFARSVLTTLGDCMSPIAMLLTGMTIARIDLKSTLTNALLYAVSLIRLLAIPLLAIAVLRILKLSYGIEACIVCNLAMPLGLSTVVIPASYGKDTSTAAGMALLSHLLSCATIPLIFMLFEMLAV